MSTDRENTNIVGWDKDTGEEINITGFWRGDKLIVIGVDREFSKARMAHRLEKTLEEQGDKDGI